jgi:hypothetical protein
MSDQPMPLQPMTPNRSRSLGATVFVASAALATGTNPAPSAARDEPLMKRLRDSLMSPSFA